tara:strand:+ start:755 stop:1240 length:486 start_codon:yes stop_codon:yes gene_type:complete
MGSAVSTRLVKPDDCDKEVWSKILKLFDRLDKDGTHSIEENELMGHITNLHTKNNLRRIRKEKEIYKQNNLFEKEKIHFDLERKINKLRKDAKQLIDELSEKNNTHQNELDISIKTLQEMSQEDKAKKIKSVMCGKKQSIEFWDFYKYMKNRTEDIPNIVW